MTSKFYYRFRNAKSLFDFNELETQQIFFCPPDGLNDPIEGFKDIFWKGDEVLWTNFFRHYLISLYEFNAILSLSQKDEIHSVKNLPIFRSFTTLPTVFYQKNMERIFEVFFGNEEIKSLIKGLSGRDKVRRDELLFYLHPVHMYSVRLIHEIFEPDFKPSMVNVELSIFKKDIFTLLKQAKDEVGDMEGVEEVLFSAFRHSSLQTQLIAVLNNEHLMDENKKLYLIDYPNVYLQRLQALMYPEWYTACFSEDPTNASMWGYYAGDHKGVCFKFKAEEKNGQDGIQLLTVIGYGGTKEKSTYSWGHRFFPFYKINYGSKYPDIDFFRSIGRITYPQLMSDWYMHEDVKSNRFDEIFKDEKAWIHSYWQEFYKNIPIKLKEWEHEKEYRLILSGVLNNEISKEHRLLKYRFSDLEGIIFGINMSDSDKIRIIKQISEKCEKEKRDDFSFYQAHYDSRTGKINIETLNLLKFSPK